MTGTIKPETKKLIDQIKEPCILISGDGLTLIAGMKPATAIGVLEVSKAYLLDNMVRDIARMERKEALKIMDEERPEGKRKEGNGMEGKGMAKKNKEGYDLIGLEDNPYERKIRFSKPSGMEKIITLKKKTYHLFHYDNLNRFGNVIGAKWTTACPDCGIIGDLDTDQWHGRVSIQCPGEGCKFHETINFGLETGEDG